MPDRRHEKVGTVLVFINGSELVILRPADPLDHAIVNHAERVTWNQLHRRTGTGPNQSFLTVKRGHVRYE